ncbi:MAG: PUA domain-containing protein [Candidatus Hadarchaeales archaeon]
MKEVVLLSSGFGIRPESLENAEMMELDSGEIIIVAGKKPLLFEHEGRFCPTVHALLEGAVLPRVTVDMGAVPHVAAGADVMAPGVRRADPGIVAGVCVAVVDERHGKPIAVGIALVDSGEMVAPKGKVIRTIHHVGDRIWKLLE